MTTRYVGIGGNDGSSGLTWVLRKLTLNGVEDTPVVAGDVVYVGPGAYRELLTVDVSGGAGNYITYIADITGEHTDGVGGIVRVTGSDNDTTAARANCITANAMDYRIFRGFSFDTTSGIMLNLVGSPEHWNFEDCTVQVGAAASQTVYVLGDTQLDVSFYRCMFLSARPGTYTIEYQSTGVQNGQHVVENCLFLGGRMMDIDDVGGIAVRNCVSIAAVRGIYVTDSPPVGFTAITVNNCLLIGCSQNALSAVILGQIVENYNTFYLNATDRNNVAVGANSQAYPPLFLPPLLHAGASQASGFVFPWWFGQLSEWSAVRAITGSNEPGVDLHGIARPVTASKNSWGPIQFHDMERETGTVRAGTASLVLHDAGRHQIWVPVTATSTTISVYVYREANYAGNLPQMIIKQPGQADDVTTDVAAASQWNLLTTTLTPAADPPYVVVELVSRNTNGANDEVFFDDLVVS